jgi:hypothetical protein
MVVITEGLDLDILNSQYSNHIELEECYKEKWYLKNLLTEREIKLYRLKTLLKYSIIANIVLTLTLVLIVIKYVL